MAEPIEMQFGTLTWVAQGTMCWGSRSPRVKQQFWGWNGAGRVHAETCLVVDILKAGYNQYGADAIWGVQDGIRLAQPDKYDWIVLVQRRCSLISNYFDQCCYYYTTVLGTEPEYFCNISQKSVNVTEVEEQRASLIALWWHVLRTVLVVVFSSEARHVRRTGSIDRGDHRVKDHRAPSGAIINKLSCSAFSQAWLQFTLFVQSVVLNFTRYDEVLRHDLWHPITLYISVFIQ